MKNKKLEETVVGALGIALVFLATYFIKIPNGLQGYFNLGDGFILLFSSFLNPLAAFLVGGVGSAMADAAGGYGIYILPTLLIKGTEAIVVSQIMRKIKKEPMRILPYLIGSLIMLIGYFLADSYINESWQLGVASVFANVVQAGAGMIIAYLAFPLMKKNITFTQRRHLKS